MTALQEYLAAKKQVDEAKRLRDRALGALEQIRSQAQQSFSVTTADEVDSLLEDRKAVRTDLEKRLSRELERLARKWPQLRE